MTCPLLQSVRCRAYARLHVAAIYHFTHGKNLPGILAADELRSSEAAATEADIADSRIKTSRTSRAVGGQPWSSHWPLSRLVPPTAITDIRRLLTDIQNLANGHTTS